jgi:hypothetical protein
MRIRGAAIGSIAGVAKGDERSGDRLERQEQADDQAAP